MAKNELILYGTVGASWWEEEFFTAKTVRDELAQMTGDIVVRINSGGGIASEGQAIYTALVDYPGKVTVQVDGVAASAASLIAMAGDEIIMRRGAWMLIHDPATPWTMGRGTEEDHLKEAELLRVISGAYADIYAARSGKSREECRAVMQDETVLDGPMAVEMGFATSVETDGDPVAIATFDYRIYAHAPDEARKASRNLGRAPVKKAVMAMFAGRARSQAQEKPKMAEKTLMAAGATLAAAEDATTEEPTIASPSIEAGDQKAEVTAPSAEDAALKATARARRILASTTLAGLPTAFADELIASKKSVEEALDDITAKWKENGDVDTPMTGAPTARITRDEVDTRRQGMTQALVAQMRRRDPETDAARPFMEMGIIAMAAESIGHKGAIRSAGDKVEILMNATHSRSDFPGIFQNALNKVLLDRYEVQAPTYKLISRKRNFNDFRAHPMVRAGDFPKLQAVGEGGEIKYGTFGERNETAILSSYGIALRISRQMMIDDDLGAIDDMVGDYGSSIANFEEETFYTFMLAATLASDGGSVWQTGATRGNLAGAGTAITVASLGAGRAAMRKQTSIDGMKLNLAPSILLVGPDKETEADQLVTSIVPNQPSSVNPFSGRLQVVSSAQLTGNIWFLFADPNRAGGACFVHGFLNGAEAPRLRMDEPFGQQGLSLSVEHDFGLGAIDFRGTYRNPGA
jgi:ATP-dependent protease ClpP protease subunit